VFIPNLVGIKELWRSSLLVRCTLALLANSTFILLFVLLADGYQIQAWNHLDLYHGAGIAHCEDLVMHRESGRALEHTRAGVVRLLIATCRREYLNQITTVNAILDASPSTNHHGIGALGHFQDRWHFFELHQAKREGIERANTLDRLNIRSSTTSQCMVSIASKRSRILKNLPP
jgi:hypothetical protein